MKTEDNRIKETEERAKKIAESARISLSQLIEAMNKLSAEIMRAAKELMTFNVESIQEVRCSAQRRRFKGYWGYKPKYNPKRREVHPKKKWFRTRSNPFNKRGGQRARDKPDKQPKTSERK